MSRKLFFCLIPFLVSSLFAGLAEKEKALKLAVKAKNGSQVISLSRELLKSGETEAIKVVLNYALLCDNYKAERMVAWELSQLPEDKRDLICKTARTHPRYEVRVVLSAVLASFNDKKSFDTLCAMAGDRMPSVALAAITHIVRKDDIQAIDPLINLLQKREKYGGLIPNAIEKALKALTGVKDDYVASEWKKWWEPRRKTFTKADAHKTKERFNRTVVRSRNTFFGLEVVSKHILFILDMSGSMKKRDELLPEPAGNMGGMTGGGRTQVQKRETQKKKNRKKEKLPKSRERLYRVQQELIRTIKRLTPDTHFTVMAFNQQIKMLSETPKLATAAFKKKAIAFAESFKPEGETWTDTALEKAFKMKNEIDTLFLLSDGYPQRKQKLINMDKIIGFVKQENRFRKIQVNTIGFVQIGRTMARFLTTLAVQNGGTYKGLR